MMIGNLRMHLERGCRKGKEVGSGLQQGGQESCKFLYV